jgi:hypothetical protein
MPGVLTMTSKVVCGHSGTVTVQSTEKLRVGATKDPVLVESSIDGKPITGCLTPAASDPSGPTAAKCLTVSTVPPTPPPAITAGRSQKLKVNNQPVMLDTLKGLTNGMVSKVTPQTLLSATAVQTKLKSI